MAVETFAAVAVPVVLALAWLFRLEGKVNEHANLFGRIESDVKYIRERVDRALNGRHE